jgi:putative membrane protein
MAGMLYLPRLFVYHAMAPADSKEAETFIVMERRLYRGIMLPALIVTWITGLALAYEAGFFQAGWLYGKLVLVLAMTGFHGYFGALRRKFMMKQNSHTARFYRILNEVPTLLLIGIVVLVIVKPF